MLSSLAMFRPLFVTLRPHQWVKNLFVAAPLVFAKRLTDGEAVLRELAAVFVFCALAGAVYAYNDVLDAEADRAHPTKRHRPIASGALAPRLALIASGALGLGALLGASLLSGAFVSVAVSYLILNLAYSVRLKEIAFVDVLSITTGFLLRVLGGALAIGVSPSPWLLVCTGLLASFLAFGKRAHELSQSSGTATRRVLSQYDPKQLHAALYALAALTVLSYAAYTQATHTIAFFGTERMLWTTPFCLVGIGRFLVLTRRSAGDGPTEQMLRDAPFMINLGLWGLAVLGIIYFR